MCHYGFLRGDSNWYVPGAMGFRNISRKGINVVFSVKISDWFVPVVDVDIISQGGSTRDIKKKHHNSILYGVELGGDDEHTHSNSKNTPHQT